MIVTQFVTTALQEGKPVFKQEVDEYAFNRIG